MERTTYLKTPHTRLHGAIYNLAHGRGSIHGGGIFNNPAAFFEKSLCPFKTFPNVKTAKKNGLRRRSEIHEYKEILRCLTSSFVFDSEFKTNVSIFATSSASHLLTFRERGYTFCTIRKKGKYLVSKSNHDRVV